jgi:hypothetical protein
VLQGGACNEKSDIWSFGILMWEVLSDAAEPHAGKADAEVREVVKGHKGNVEQLVSIAEGCAVNEWYNSS